MATIPELERDFQHRLDAFGATYGHFESCERGDRVLYGEHVTVRLPEAYRPTAKVARQLEAIVAAYWGTVERYILPRLLTSYGGDSAKRWEVVFVLDRQGDY